MEAIRDRDFVQGGGDRGECDLNKFRAIAYPGNGDYVNASLHKKRVSAYQLADYDSRAPIPRSV